MKYLLVEHADGNDPKQLTIFDTVDARARATREALEKLIAEMTPNQISQFDALVTAAHGAERKESTT